LRTYVDNTTLLQIAFDKPFWERHGFPEWATNPWKGAETSAPFDQEFFLVRKWCKLKSNRLSRQFILMNFSFRL
jgi:hypothetical protein